MVGIINGMGEMRIVEIEVIREEEERERDLYFPWLQVHITVPRHHLASSLRAERRGLNESRSIYRVSKYGLKVRSPVRCRSARSERKKR